MVLNQKQVYWTVNASNRKQETFYSITFASSRSKTIKRSCYRVKASASFRWPLKQTEPARVFRVCKTCQNRCTLLWLLLFSPHSLRAPNRAPLCLGGHWNSPDVCTVNSISLPFDSYFFFFSLFSFFCCEVPFCPLFELRWRITLWMEVGVRTKWAEWMTWEGGKLWRVMGCND